MPDHWKESLMNWNGCRVYSKKMPSRIGVVIESMRQNVLIMWEDGTSVWASKKGLVKLPNPYGI
jgi:hypothetical protein